MKTLWVSYKCYNDIGSGNGEIVITGGFENCRMENPEHIEETRKMILSNCREKDPSLQSVFILNWKHL